MKFEDVAQPPLTSNVLMWPQFGCKQFALTPLTLVRMVSWMFEILLSFVLKSAMFCHMDNFDSTKVSFFGLVQTLECALYWFAMEPIHKPKLYNCHLHGVGVTYPKHVLVNAYVQIDSQLLWKHLVHSNATHLKHLMLEFVCWTYVGA